MIYLFYTLHILVCVFLILVVLLQQGKGADLSVFGGGSTQTAFGARGAATLLHKLTVICFVLFIVTTMGIAVMQGGGASATVMRAVGAEVPEADEAAAPDAVPAPVEAPDGGAVDTAPDTAPAPEGGPGEGAPSAAGEDEGGNAAAPETGGGNP